MNKTRKWWNKILIYFKRVYEKLNEPINVAIVYDQFTEDQKLMRVIFFMFNFINIAWVLKLSLFYFFQLKENKFVRKLFLSEYRAGFLLIEAINILFFLKTLNELCQAYKYLANFYLKKMKLDNAYDAAFKCLEFPEVYNKMG